MTATEVLRRLLDERGVEWGDIDTGGKRSLITLWHDAGGMEWQFYENTKTNWTLLKSRRDYLTPAQAIAATLGPCNCSNSERTGTCHADETDTWECVCDQAGRYGKRVTIHVTECSECGHTYEHVNGGYEFCPRCGRRIVEVDE